MTLPNISIAVVEWLEMTQWSYENVSLNFCFFKFCVDMSQRDMSNRPDRMRGE